MFTINPTYKDSIKQVGETTLEVSPTNAPSFDIIVEGDASELAPSIITGTVISKKDSNKKITYSLHSHSSMRFAQFMASLTDVQCTDMVKKK